MIIYRKNEIKYLRYLKWNYQKIYVCLKIIKNLILIKYL